MTTALQMLYAQAMTCPEVFNRRGTAIVKAFAILMMIFYHFYTGAGVSSSAYSEMRVSDFSRLCVSLAPVGGICIWLFAFVTGYGYCCAADSEPKNMVRASLNRVSRFYPLFVCFCFLFVLLAYFVPYGDKICRDRVCEFLMTPLGLWRSGIIDYWYIAVVLLASFVCYPLLLSGKRRGAGAYAAVYLILWFLTFFDIFGLISSDFIVKTNLPQAVDTLRFFLFGWAIASMRRENRVLSCFMLLLTIAGFLPDWTCYIVFVFALLIAFVLQFLPVKWIWPFLLLGKFSACMWLNHRLIFGYWFSNAFYRIPTPLNFILVVLISLAVSFVVMFVWNRIITPVDIRWHRK
ncbi:MAG: acyltransferase family protein [Akkermansia muciniphila]|nr:acyltransferase family protein [Akkermansia muciniphila]